MLIPFCADGVYEGKRTSATSFLFSLNCKNTSSPLKFPIKSFRRHYAAEHRHNYGPTFGEGELRILSKAVQSYKLIGSNYQSAVGPIQLFESIQLYSSDIEVLFKRGKFRV